MQLLSIIFITVIGATFLVFAVTASFTQRTVPLWRRLLAPIASALLILGAGGFFASAISATGGLNSLPPSFEWPVGRATGIVSLPDGTHIVPHTPSGRIQVYDRDWRFLRGWHVDAGGGTFKVNRIDPDRIEVVTARGQQRYVYTLDGNLLTTETYAPRSYSSFPESAESHVVPTKPWLWSFSHPFLSWGVGMLGMAVLVVVSKKGG